MLSKEDKEMYLSEAEELLGLLKQSLIELEKDHGNTGAFHGIYRSAHNLKSSAAVAGMVIKICCCLLNM